MKNTFSLIMALLCLAGGIIAQPINNQIKDVVMPAPNAASLGKYGDIPISYYTGVPNIGVPIYTVTDGPVSLPISLSYHAGGMKVGEPVSWVGLGWSLQAGGMITRTVQGRADELADGYFTSGRFIYIDQTINEFNDTIRCIASSGNPPQYTYATIQNGTIDAEPDIFSFSVGGYNGKFYIEADDSDPDLLGKVVLVPKQDVRVIYDASQNGVYRIKNFTIITPDGTKYQFGSIGNDASNNCIDIQKLNESSFNEATSWHLRKISSADGNYSITLNYTLEKYRYNYKATGSREWDPFNAYPTTTPNGGYYNHVVDVLAWRLSSITSPTATATFVAAAAVRTDLSTTTWNPGVTADTPKALAQIKIESGTFCKQFDLSQTYYEDAFSDKSGTPADKRLKLTGIQEKSCSDVNFQVRPYSFEYYEHATVPNFLPTRMSSAIDHWGFYNGASTNVHYGLNIPSTTLSYTTTTAPHVPVTDTKGGSNRTTDEEKMKLGTLKKISYPTGGATTFEYEANTYYETGTSGLLAPQEQLEGSWSGSQRISQSAAVVVSKTLPKGDTLRYKWENLALEPVSEGDISTATIKVFKESDNTFLGQVSVAAMYRDSAKAMVRQGPLTDLIEDLPSNTPLRFEMSGADMNSSFTFQQMDLAAVNENVKIGGLRVKKITNHDGKSATNDVVKTYVYEGDTPGLSSGLLYGKPVYGHIFLECIGQCTFPDSIEYCQNVSTHFFFETSVVPLGSFEGYHVGYSSVKEYLGSTSSHYNIYKYFNEAGPSFAGLPVVPIQPRIGLGELQSRHQVYNGGVSAYIAYDTYGKKVETDQIGLGTYIKFNTYRTGGNSNGTPITFWKQYPIKTRPFRYETIQSYLDGKVTTVTRQYNGNGHLQMTKETFSNSDGKAHETEYKYPSDLVGLPAAQLAAFNSLNLLVPLETNIKAGTTQVKGNKIEYAFFDNVSGAFSSTTVSSASNFIRPYQFYNYEAGWVKKGQIDSYHGTGSATGRAGLPKQFTKTGWAAENYEWTTAGLIKKRTFSGFNWQYEYAANTALVTKITNPDGQFTEYTYDRLMRLGQAKARLNATDTIHNVITSYGYTYPTVDGGVITSFGKVKATTTFTAVTGSGLGTQETFQYFDGLGRGIETVNKAKTATGKDQVIAMGYDTRGRLSKTFEPFASTLSDGSYQAPGSTPFTLTQYEDGPLDRVWKVTPPSWATTTTTYGTNSVEDAAKNYNFVNSNSTNFTADLLAKTTVTDGNGNKTITFTDKKGRMLLSRKANGDEKSRSDTYYVYDDKDRLVRVIPPGAAWGDAELVFTYQYTNNDLISEKKVPGKGKEVYEYNSRDLPVKYQDPFLRANSNRWMGSKYDTYGRLTEKGVWASGSGDAVVLTNKIIENIYGTTGIEIDKLKTSKVQAFTVADPVVTPGAANGVLQTTFNYDIFGRVSSTTGNNHTNLGSLTAESVTYGYDHGDNILSESRTSVHSAGTTTVASTRLFDSWGRLTQTSQGINGAAATIISRLAYTDKDQLAQKKIGPGANGLQQVDYGYLTNGLLSSINGTTALSGNAQGINSMTTGFTVPTFAATTEDLFRQELRYNTNITASGATVQHSGNIGQMSWQVKGRTTQTYGFTYDYLDRLTDARFSNNKTDGTADPDDYYGESQTFDVRGNITTITRKGMVKGTTNYTRSNIDGQALTIPAGGNLTEKSEGSNSSSSSADDNFDAPHNHLNLPTKFQFSSNNAIELLYDGRGNKLRKTIKTTGSTTLTHDYLGGIELKNNKVDAVYNEDGRAFNTAASGQTYRYEYALRDHLGNTRVVFSDKTGSGSIDGTEILSETHYYPFGKTFDGAWYNDATASKYKYLYNGKELNDEFNLNFYDYGARWLDPGVGSWWQIDPLSDVNRRWSPYAYGNNNPIRFIDPDGMDSQTIYDFNGVAHTVTDDDYVKPNRADAGGCPPPCPQTVAKADATNLAQNAVTPQIADGSVQLPPQIEAQLSNADSKYAPHEVAGHEGILLGLNMIASETALNVAWKYGSGLLKAKNLATNSGANPYSGVRAASKYLQEIGVPRAYRKQVLQSFETETISLRIATMNTFGLRFYGGAASQEGRYLFPTFTNYTTRAGMALPPKWNSMSGISQFQINPGSTYIYGRAASQGGVYTGGSYQMYVPNLGNIIK